jgi:hypothetical protein
MKENIELVKNEEKEHIINSENVIKEFNNLINTWNIEKYENKYIIEYLKKLENNINYNLIYRNNENYNLLEKFILEIVFFQLKERKIVFDKNNYFIDFSLTSLNGFKTELDNTDNSLPIFSIIFYLFDNKKKNILFTNIDNESYKYKEITNNNLLSISIPKKNNYIVFNSRNIFGSINNITDGLLDNNDFDDLFLQINVSEKKRNFNNYDSEFLNFEQLIILNDVLKLFHKENNSILHKNIYSNDLLENILYENIISNKIINNNENINNLIINTFPSNEVDYMDLKYKLGIDADDIFPFINNSNIILENNRFNKKHIIQNALSKESCYWILNECFKNKNWNKSNYINYDTYLNIELLPHIFNFLLFISNLWILNIKELYNLKNTKLSISDMFITKYTKNIVQDNIFNYDGSLLVLNISLNSNLDYENGSIVFETNKNESIILNQGDMIVYNGKCLRNKSTVTNGEKYYIVLMIDVFLDE